MRIFASLTVSAVGVSDVGESDDVVGFLLVVDEE